MELTPPTSDLYAKLAGVVFIVEATAFEKDCLYVQQRERQVRWDREVSARFVPLGTVHDRPVCVHLSWANINDRKVMFVEPMSELFDHSLLKAWLDVYCAPRYENGTRDARNTAREFRECLRAVRQYDEQMGRANACLMA